ncbi:hypothetical protein POSPLADRAFT_1144526 [Postia placenta MAD-698-R-SB12]|uniref:DUF6533 domain-containing protein n=1 Tax=Postia placenta MAD-698-R-SB12 TaxID=670580 RepID=A0A1X6MZ10_9APHY|nr:hypothetical protein POSPLADRAFT_1144526 [Postia placenta MAD-698-R-SB12]OSX61456.1 hypothetical protein POSPLADRAFT_1144526 [Postia placenta MAD-698-R-SB12]
MSESSMNKERVLQLIWYGLIGDYIDIMTMSIFVYDSIISFNMEWRAVWARRITGAAAIYVALRYVTLASVIASVIIDDMQACEVTFASIRVFAIDGRQWRNASVVMILGLVPVALNIYGCSQEYVYCTAEILAIERSFSASKSNKESLASMLLRDGTVHFVLVLCLNVANIASALSTESLFDFSISVELISTVILCRFFLNLRHFSSSSDVNESTVPSLGSTFARFATRVIGNMGETLEDDPQAFDDDLDCELERHPGAEELGSANDFQDGANTPSGTRAVTLSVRKREAHEATADDWEAPEAADEGFDRHAIDIV